MRTILLLLFFSSPALAALNVVPRERIEAALVQEAKNFRKHSQTSNWLENSPSLSSFEREFLRQDERLPKNLPSLSLKFSPKQTLVIVGELEADLRDLGFGRISVNGKVIDIPARASTFQIAKLIDEAVSPKRRAGWIRFFENLGPAEAFAETEMDKICVGNWEFLHRSPYSVLDSKVGYLPKLILASVVFPVANGIRGVFANCDQQIADLKALMKAENIGLKELSCGSDDSGADISMEFWHPEYDREAKEFKTKKFDLDYSLWLAQERHSEEEKDEAKEKKKPLKPENLFVFGPDSLQEVRAPKPNKENNDYACESTKPGDKNFEEMKKFISPYQKVFAFFGTYNSCAACKKEMLLRARMPYAPSYFAVPVKAPTAPNRQAPKKGSLPAN